jgi:Flp pilus assembly pilin Flp
MQAIASQVQEKSLAFAVYTQSLVTAFVEGAKERMSQEDGQGAIEYGGILVIIGLIFSALFALKIPSHVKSWASSALDNIQSGADCKKDC